MTSNIRPIPNKKNSSPKQPHEKSNIGELSEYDAELEPNANTRFNV